MSYENTLGEQSLQLAMAVANSGKEIRHINLALLNELVNELKCGKNNDGMVTVLSDSAIEQLRTVLQTVSSQTFNQAVPMIKNIMEKLNSVVNPDIPVAYSQYDCVPIIFGDLWDTQLVTEMVEYGKTTAPDATSFAGMIKSVDDEAFADLVALTETGLGQFDDQVRALMGQFDEAQIRNLFTYAVLDGTLPALNPASNMTDSANGLLGFNAWLLLALWARRLHTMAPTSSDMSLSRYQACCLNLEKQAHAAMASIAEHRRSHAEAGRLIVKAEQNKVYVLNDLYVTYLAEGGTVEAIMGVITSRDKFGQSISLIKDIKENQANLETAWARHIQASKLASGQQSNALARRQFAVIMEETAKWHYGDDEGKVLPVNQGAYASAMDRIEEVMNKLPSDFVKDCHTHVFDAVAYVFYPKSDVARLLSNLREVGDIKDSGLSAEEVRVIANLHFVGDWLADIIALGDHGHGALQYTNELFPVSIANKQDGEMGLEGLSVKQGAAIVGGIALVAIIGYAAYKMLNKGKSTVDKLDKASTSTADAIEKAEEAVAEAVKEEPAKRMVKCRDLYNNEGIRHRLENIPLNHLEAIAKGSDFHPDKNIKSSISLIISLHESFQVFETMANSIKSGGDDKTIVDKIIQTKQKVMDGLKDSIGKLFKDITGNTLPQVSSFEEAIEKGDKLVTEVQERFIALKPTEEDVKRLFDNDHEVNIQKLMSVLIPARKLLRGEMKTKISDITKVMNGDGDGEPQSVKDLEEYRNVLKERNPEQFDRLKELDDEDENDVQSGFMDAVIKITTMTTIFDLSSIKAISGVCWAAMKLEKTAA